MSADMYLMKQNYVGVVEDMEFYQSARDSMHEVIRSFLSEDVEVYESRMTDEPRHIRAIIQNQTTDNPMYANLRQIVTECGVNLQCGNYIRYKGDWWLIAYLPGSNQMYEKAYLWYCNYMLKFRSPLTDKDAVYPAYVLNSTQYNSGERETRRIRYGTSQRLVYVPCNRETLLLENGMRLFIDLKEEHPTAYRLTHVDTTSHSYSNQVGIIQMTATEDYFDEVTDDPTIGIADDREYGAPPHSEGSSMFG